jgi:hypothetical protein
MFNIAKGFIATEDTPILQIPLFIKINFRNNNIYIYHHSSSHHTKIIIEDIKYPILRNGKSFLG